jgi:rhodanese-related sulfurtransferase
MLKSPAELVGEAKATIRECTVQDVADCLQSDTIVIDIREAAELRKGFLPGAIHLPRGMLEFEIHKLVDQYRVDENVPSVDQPIVMYCGIGGRSALAALTLHNMGFGNVRSMAGGISAWREANLDLQYPDRN